MKTKMFMAGLFLASVFLAVGKFVMATPEIGLTSVYVDGTLTEPIFDPNSLLWDKATALEIPLSGQTVQTPMRFEPFTDKIHVKSLNNGSDIAFLIVWSDSSKNDRTVKTEEFRDAVAIQFAGAERPFICMGAVGQRVNILHWKADWQKDIDEGFQDLQHAFPDFWVDYYPYALGGPPYQIVNETFPFPETARVYLPGWQVGNPFSDPLKVTPIEETIAQGFGTITTQNNQNSIGRGIWQQEQWKVVIARKLNTMDPDDLQLLPTEGHAVAFAVWDGESGDVGARKSISAWVSLNIQSPLWYAWLLPLIPILILIVVAVSIILAFLLIKRKT